MNPRAGEQRWLRLLETLTGLALLAMLALTVADVFGRYLVNRPVPGVTELVQYTMVLLVFAGLPIVTHRRAHISVSLMDNAFIESLNGKFRAECLSAHWFMSLDDARVKCEAWRRDYNEVRPDSRIGNKPPASLVNSVSGTRPTPTE